MGTYNRSCGRVSIEVTEDGSRMHGYGHGVRVSCVDGWNANCPTLSLTMSVEELHDLRHLIDRALAAAEGSLMSKVA